jgi:tripartite-type tricarboxylate transporter receptor subunit TctC
VQIRKRLTHYFLRSTVASGILGLMGECIVSFRILKIALTAISLFVAGSYAGFAQQSSYPNRSIKIVVPFAPGGGVDAMARVIAEKLAAKFGVTVFVENRAGANGIVGGSYVQQAAPDGYTLLLSSNTHSMAKQVMRNPPYDPLTDFSFVARIGEAPLLTVLSTTQPETTLGEIATSIKKKPEAWTAGTPALGSPGHIATIAFMQLTKTNLTVTPYRGTAPALNDVVGGHIQLLTDAIIVLLPMAKSGKVKGIAVTSAHRSKLAPEIPTAAESGVPGLNVVAWYGIWGPKGMSADVTTKLNAAVAQATRELSEDGRLATFGVEPVYETPEQFSHYTAAEVARNAELLKSVNFQPE